MALWALMRLGHALGGVAFVTGLAGIWIVGGLIRREDSLERMQTLTRAVEPFGRLTTIGGAVMAILGVATTIALGRPLLGPLQSGTVDWLFVSVLLILPLLAFIAVVYPTRGRAIAAALADATARGTLTPERGAARNDPVLRWARTYELVAVVIVLGLMIAKPF
jgi:ABC-type multidrug transport system fused ATPase/permease subunit